VEDKKLAARIRAKEWYEANKEKAKAYAEANKEKRAENKRRWVDENREKVYAENRERQKLDKEGVRRRVLRYKKTVNGDIVHRASRDAYRARCKEASLGRFDMKKIYRIYKLCKEVSVRTGVEHHVDHIVPIRHPLVCGLHLSWNLQIIPKKDNLSKNNHFEG
jgi:5-methylcytosine-specific restriction endonuclease McrA